MCLIDRGRLAAYIDGLVKALSCTGLNSSQTTKISGERLCELDKDTEAGQGTYSLNGFIFSSVAGRRADTKLDSGKLCVEVKTPNEPTAVPEIGALVSAKVTNVNPRFCKCNILTVEQRPLREHFRGILRKEDVRATEKEKVEMYKSFRPGDVILARVYMVGEALSYLLTTAENDLGVVIAKSEAGAVMVPISWCEMQCPITMAREYRKVARVQKEYLQYARPDR